MAKRARKVVPLRATGTATFEDRVLVGILTDSPSDLPVVAGAREVLDSLGIRSDIRVLSAHRTPEDTVAYVSSARERGIEVLIACAGMAAHLAGVVAAHTTLPVIGVPLSSGPLQGMDALLSTVQMPSGIPVATVAIGGAKNAGYLAARILAGAHPELHDRIRAQMDESKSRYDSPDPFVPAQADARPKKKKPKK